MSLLEFQSVKYEADGKAILSEISFEVEGHDFISIVGASGSGKSTLLRLCAHLISQSEGKIYYHKRDYNEYDPITIRKNIGYCSQLPYLFGETVKDNFEFVFRNRNLKIDYEMLEVLLSSFRFDLTYLERKVEKLSGGEKQRIALARTILFKPDILLLDEITSALDVESTLSVEEVIWDLNKQGVTVLWITHNVDQSRKYANKLLTLEDGKIKAMEVIR